MLEACNNTAVSSSRAWRLIRWSLAVALLLAPLVAMLFTDEVNWTLGDFVFAAVLIGATGLAFELALRACASLMFRAAAALTLGTTFLLIWVNAAVGIIGDSANAANLLYGLIVAIVVLTTIASGFAPVAMSRATAAAAVVQGMITIAAVLTGWGEPASSPVELVAINGFFIVLWLSAMLLFRPAAAEAAPGGCR